MYVCVCYNLHSSPYIIPSIRSAVLKLLYKQFCGFNHMRNRWSHCRARCLEPARCCSTIQLYLISRCDSTATAFKQDE